MNIGPIDAGQNVSNNVTSHKVCYKYFDKLRVQHLVLWNLIYDNKI